MSNPLTDPDDPISRLFADGYDLLLQAGHLIVRRVPYLSSDGPHTDGHLVLPVNDSGVVVTDAIGDHTIWFTGQTPLDEHRAPLGTASPRNLGDAGSVDFLLSFKPRSGTYAGIDEKIRTYARILSTPARRIDPTVTATPGAAFQVVEDDLPLMYRDTNSSRASLTALNNLFRGHRIAIMGLGGTGSYILDHVAKTWIDRIDLFDGDIFENHNAFRAPGAASREILRAGRTKADYFAAEYSRMHTGIVAHPEPLTMTNVGMLADATFVFLAAADAAERPSIMAWLRDRAIPFVDVGMGLQQNDDGRLFGLVRSTMHLPGDNTTLPTQPAAPPDQDDYSTNIQVADLNALNALLAVIAWKRHLGFYATHSPATETVYKIFTNELRNGDAT